MSTVAENLKFSKGAVSKALLEAAGPQLQSAAYEEARGGVKCGEMVITDGFNLRCSKVFHTVCPPWDNGGGKSEEVCGWFHYIFTPFFVVLVSSEHHIILFHAKLFASARTKYVTF